MNYQTNRYENLGKTQCLKASCSLSQIAEDVNVLVEEMQASLMESTQGFDDWPNWAGTGQRLFSDPADSPTHQKMVWDIKIRTLNLEKQWFRKQCARVSRKQPRTPSILADVQALIQEGLRLNRVSAALNQQLRRLKRKSR